MKSENSVATNNKHGLFQLIYLFCIMLIYSFYFITFTITKYNQCNSTIFDIGIFDQAVWLIAHGKPIFLTTRGLTIFGDHFSAILYLIAPLYHIWDTPRALLVLQTFACAIGAHPVYLYAKQRLSDPRLGLLFAIGYLLYPALQGLNCFDFHPESIAVPLLLYGWWFIETNNIKMLTLVLSLALLCKETIGLVIILMGVYILFSKNWRIGLSITALGLVGLIISLEVIKIANNGAQSAYFTFYSNYGSTPVILAYNLIQHPNLLFSALSSGDNIQCLLDLFAPLAFLPFLSPETLFIAFPIMLSNILSNRGSMHTVYFQYTAPIIPIFFIASIRGYEQALQLFANRNYIINVYWNGFITTILLCCIIYSVQNDQLIGHPTVSWAPLNTYDIQSIRNGLDLIPSEASVSAQTAIGAHLTHRERLYMFPNPFQHMCWGNSEEALQQEGEQDIHLKSVNSYRMSLRSSGVDYIVFGPLNSSTFPLPSNAYYFFLHLILTDRHYGAIWVKQICILKRGANFNKGCELIMHSEYKKYL